MTVGPHTCQVRDARSDKSFSSENENALLRALAMRGAHLAQRSHGLHSLGSRGASSQRRQWRAPRDWID
eukprot:scaffold1511_cov347-Prasinococcus_capsulatus_cf.AAC.6